MKTRKRLLTLLLVLAMVMPHSLTIASAYDEEIQEEVLEEPAEEEPEIVEEEAVYEEEIYEEAAEEEISEEVTGETADRSVFQVRKRAVKRYTQASAESFEDLVASDDGSGVALDFAATLTEDMTLDSEVFIYEGGELIVPSGRTLTLDYGVLYLEGGTLEVQTGGRLVCGEDAYVDVSYGVLVLKGTVDLVNLINIYDPSACRITCEDTSVLAMTEYVTTEKALEAAVANQTGYGAVNVVLADNMVLSQDLTVPQNLILTLDASAKLTLAGGCTMTLAEGSALMIASGAELQVEHGASLVISKAAQMTNMGTVAVAGTLDNSKGYVFNRGVVRYSGTLLQGNGWTGKQPEKEAPADSITLAEASLELDSEVFVKIYVSVEGFADVDLTQNMGLLIWNGEGSCQEDELVVGNENTIDLPGAESSGDYYAVRTEGIAAKELGDVFDCCVYARRKDGSYVYSDVITYGPEVYARTVLEESDDSELKELVVAMLDYAAAAQERFGYPAETSVNALADEYAQYRTEYHSAMLQPVEPADPAVVGEWSTAENAGNCQISATLVLEEAITEKFLFRFADDILAQGIRCAEFLIWDSETYASLLASGEQFSRENAVVTTMEYVGGKYVGRYDQCAVKDLGDTIYVCAVVETQDAEYVSGVISYNGHYYLQAMAEDDLEQAVVKALAVYSAAADTYFS